MTLGNFKPQRVNANKHTPKGLGELADSIQRDGWVGAMTVAADGEAFDGSARLETAGEIMPETEPIVVEADGTRPVIVRRVDIPSADDPRAKRLAIAANRVAELDLDWDPNVIGPLLDDGSLTDGLDGLSDGVTRMLEEILDETDDYQHPRLREKQETLEPKSMLRVLISIPLDSAIDARAIIEQVEEIDGVEVVYGAN